MDFFFLLSLLLILLTKYSFSDHVTNGTELVFAFLTHSADLSSALDPIPPLVTGLGPISGIGIVWWACSFCSILIFKSVMYGYIGAVHRHGDRTPISNRDFASYSKDPAALGQLMKKYGVGQLTPAGQRRGYQLGQFIRKRYSSLLSSRYSPSDIYIQSTDSTRTQMTVLTAMAAVYAPLEDNWSADIHWTPVPYTSTDVSQDFLTPFTGSCHKYLLYLITSRPPLTRNREALRKWSQIVGKDLSKNSFQTYVLYTDYESYRSLGLPLIDPLEEMWPEIEGVANEILDVLIGNNDTLPMLTGVLLNEFFRAAYAALPRSQISPRLRIYSSHDLNVYGLLAGVRIKREFRQTPQFGSAFSLEVRRVVNTGQIVVLPVFLPEPAEGEVLYLPIENCGLLCDLDRLKQLTSSIVLSKSKWKRACSLIPTD